MVTLSDTRQRSPSRPHGPFGAEPSGPREFMPRRHDMLRTAFTELTGCEVPIQLAGMGSVGSEALAVAVTALVFVLLRHS